MHYMVQWDVDVDGDTPYDAAMRAAEMQRDPFSDATVFNVTDEAGKQTLIDLKGK